MQQATEKYLKAFLAAHDPTLTERSFRHFGHDLAGLLDACVKTNLAFDAYRPHISKLGFDQNVRYHRPSVPPSDAVDIVNLAHEICHLAAVLLLQRDTVQPHKPST